MAQQQSSKGSSRAVWIALMVVLAGVGIVVWWSGLEPVTEPETSSVPDAPAASVNPDSTQPPDPEQIAAEQIAANEAATRLTGVDQIPGPITRRPEFVSRIEWQVLNQVAQRSPDSDKELTRLVNKLRFAKQLESWKLLAGTANVEQRTALAEQLLRDIPVRVSRHDLGAVRAQQLQAELLTSLYPDPRLRRQRMAEEAERIGVEFQVESVGHDPGIDG